MALDLSFKQNTVPLDLSMKRPMSPNVAVTCRQMACITMPTAQIPLDHSTPCVPETPVSSRKRPLSNSPQYGDIQGILRASQPNSALPFSVKRVCFEANVPSGTTDPEMVVRQKNTTWCVRRKMAALYRQRMQSKADDTNESVRTSTEDEQDCLVKREHKKQTSTPPPPADDVTKPIPDGRTLSTDPRHWSRDDVHFWLRQLASRCRLDDVDVSRFPMNGKGLCLMSPDMFLYRVPCSGLLLYTDFMARMRRAIAQEECANTSQTSSHPTKAATS